MGRRAMLCTLHYTTPKTAEYLCTHIAPERKTGKRGQALTIPTPLGMDELRALVEGKLEVKPADVSRKDYRRERFRGRKTFQARVALERPLVVGCD